VRRSGIVIAGVIVAAAAGGVAWVASGARGPSGLAAADSARLETAPAAARTPLELPAGDPTGSRVHAAAVLPDAEHAGTPPTPEPPREPGVRYLRVVDEAGRPVPGARLLEMRRDIIDAYDWEDYVEGGKRVDAWGRYTIELAIENDAASGWLAMGPGGRCSGIVTTPAGNRDFTLTLRPGNVIAGVVRAAATGRPVPGVTVVLAMGKTGASTWPPETVTAADGSYRFAGLPPGTPFIPVIRDEERYGGPDVYDDYELWGWDATGEPQGAEESLDSMLARGRAMRFAGTSETATIDLRPGVTPGQEVTLVLQLPDGVPADSAVACRWRRPAGAEPRDEFRRIHLKRGRSRWALFLREGSHEFEFVANGARGRLELAATGGRDARPAETVQLSATRPLVIQFVDEAGAPRRMAGIALSYGIAFERDRAVIDGRREVEARSAGASGGDGRLRYPDAPAFWPLERGVPQTLYLAADGESCFPASQRNLGLAHRPFPIAAFADALAQPGREPVVLRVPARSWVPLPVRILDSEGRPLSGISLATNRPAAFGGASSWITDGQGRATPRLHDVGALEARDDDAPSEEALVRVTTPELFGQVPVHELLTELRPAPHVIRGGVFYQRGVFTLLAAPARRIEVRFGGDTDAPQAGEVGLVVFNHGGARCTQLVRTDPSGHAALRVPVTSEPLPLRVHFAHAGSYRGTLTPGSDRLDFRADPAPEGH
jgi:hypothetical protein